MLGDMTLSPSYQRNLKVTLCCDLWSASSRKGVTNCVVPRLSLTTIPIHRCLPSNTMSPILMPTLALCSRGSTMPTPQDDPTIVLGSKRFLVLPGLHLIAEIAACVVASTDAAASSNVVSKWNSTQVALQQRGCSRLPHQPAPSPRGL